ncbi:c-type cytochrome domain-containing protein [Allorhodopirellula solitaria]|uniref:Translocation protein TolB n=1 Tax=Allorhodopirellula solitaria TaxID=2527987 RepID=A0A5C5YIR2_9BACT|nr:c-type cytochrome domain-containing protein [Allorhodopirellula solitaria]TWT74751.1 translocation protein TolB [Allorhodopirellula solitaria]
MTRCIPVLKLFVLVALATSPVAVPAAEPVDFAQDVLPILETYCVGCHTSGDGEGGFALDSHKALIAGGDSGSAVTPGAAASSRMLLMVSGKMEPAMPPEGEAQPTDEEFSLLQDWIDQGANGPASKLPCKRPLRTPEIATKDTAHLPVTAIAVSRDGKYRAIARFGEITILDENEKPISLLEADFGKVNAVTFSKDGSQLLVATGVAGAYGNALLFSVASGTLEKEWVGHRDTLYAAVFSPDETRVATAGYDREIVVWDVASGEPISKLLGHNGAIFDLAFSPDGKLLVSACADETAKVWNVESGQRLDTLSQPEGEVLAVDITHDGKFVIAASADNRLRVWSLRSTDTPKINPLLATRFVDESPLVNFSITPDGQFIVVLCESGNLKVLRVSDWSQVASLPKLPESGSDLCIDADSRHVFVSLMNGEVAHRSIPKLAASKDQDVQKLLPIYLDLGELRKIDESAATHVSEDVFNSAAVVDVPRGAEITGEISLPAQEDFYRWTARRGEVWAIDVDSNSEGNLDPRVAVLDHNGNPVLRTRLQAVRDTYFTFRGKNSSQTNDLRLFNWREMSLNEYLYASGEVVRLSMYPRGPDSGFNVYPNESERWTYFGTSHLTHALGEPAYIVRELAVGESPTANGLPVFDLYYDNDDDPMRIAGKNSRLLFTAPHDGVFVARITDTRAEGGDDYGYTCSIRAAQPRFTASIDPVKEKLRKGSGREFTVRVDRIDGFDGPVVFEIENLPPGVIANTPLTIEPGQRYAQGTLYIPKDHQGWVGSRSPLITATAQIHGKRVERTVGPVGQLEVGERPQVIPVLQPSDRTVEAGKDWTLQIRRGETVSARVVLDRQDGFDGEVKFGNETAGHNTTQGVYVDNIGLNGLLALQGMTEREFFLTADPVSQLGRRSFFLEAQTDKGITSYPITIEVLP